VDSDVTFVVTAGHGQGNEKPQQVAARLYRSNCTGSDTVMSLMGWYLRMCWARGSVATQGCLCRAQHRHHLGVPLYHSRLQRHAYLLTDLLFSGGQGEGIACREDETCLPELRSWMSKHALSTGHKHLFLVLTHTNCVNACLCIRLGRVIGSNNIVHRLR
jgi:hypothetical protein